MNTMNAQNLIEQVTREDAEKRNFIFPKRSIYAKAKASKTVLTLFSCLLIFLFFGGIVLAVTTITNRNVDSPTGTYTNLTATSINATGNITANIFKGNLSWSYLDGYPGACSSGSFLTSLDDSVTCTSISTNTYDNLTINDTVINSSGIFTSNINASTGTYTNLTAGQLFFGNTNGTFNETVAGRPLVSNAPRTISVNGAGGADYLTIQEAVNQVPYILRHEYIINVADGTYDEDVYVPAITVSGLNDPATEGSVILLGIYGNSMVNTRVKSFQITGHTGTSASHIRTFNVYGTEPTSDESVSISVYGSNSVLLSQLNMTNQSVNHPIMFYSSSGGIHTIYFDNTKNGLYAKGASQVYFGDYWNDAGIYGSVVGNLVTAGKSSIVHIQNNQVTVGGDIVENKYGIVSQRNNVTNKNTYYQFSILDGDVNITGDLISDTIHEVSSQGLIFDMNFNSANINGNIILDSSGENNHGTNDGATFNKSDGFNRGGSYNFDGVNDLIDLGADPLFDSSFVTISFWAKMDSVLDEGRMIVSGASNTNKWVIFGKVNKLYVGNTTNGLQSTTLINDSLWHHILVLTNGTTPKIYLDGIDDTSILPTGAHSIAGNSKIGSKSAGVFPFNGSIDDIRIYNRSLSVSEIKSLYLQKTEVKDSYVSQKDIQIDSNGNANITSGNLTLQQKITFALGQVIDNLVSGWLTITGSLKVTGDLNVTGTATITNITAGNLFYGSTNGTFNETVPERPFTSNGARTITVHDLGGADYTTIQAAVNQVPYMLRHEYQINVWDGTYDEDVYIPATVVSGLNDPATEGSVILLNIVGTSWNGTKVKSFHVTSAVGTSGVRISNFNIYGKEPTSDENVSIAIYGSNSVALSFLNFTSSGLANYAIMGYGSNLMIKTIHLENMSDGFLFKNTGTSYVGDYYSDGKISGSVKDDLIAVTKGTFVSLQNNQVSVTDNVFTCSGGLGMEYNNITPRTKAYCLNEISGDLRMGNDTEITFGDNGITTLKITASGNGVINQNSGALYFQYVGDSKIRLTGTALTLLDDYNLLLEGNSTFKLGMNQTARTCNEANAGAIYYNNDTNKHYGCNATTWNALY